MNFINKVIYAMYPGKCIFCGDIMSYSTDNYICDKCYAEYEHISGNTCEMCGRKIAVNNMCAGCRGKKLYYDKCFCVYEYNNDVKNFIYSMKFNGIKQNCYYAAKEMKIFAENNNIIKCDYVVPVPMKYINHFFRGYNQAEVIAKYISKLKMGKYANALVKVRITKPQHRLSGKARLENLKNAFKARTYVKDKTILLIDDVFTTGSTVNECSKALKKAGAKAVYVFCFAVVDNED